MTAQSDSRTPPRTRKPVRKDDDTPLTVRVRQLSDEELILLLKAARPEKYGGC